MICDRCGEQIESGDSHEYNGSALCDDCYMDALSPVRTCDPWATYTASRLPGEHLNSSQEKILTLLRKNKGASPEQLMADMGMSANELRREISTLKHMGLVGGEKRKDGSILLEVVKDQ